MLVEIVVDYRGLKYYVIRMIHAHSGRQGDTSTLIIHKNLNWLCGLKIVFCILDLEEDLDQFTLTRLIISLINSLNGKELIPPSQSLLWKSSTISLWQRD